jgi:hypothetical protein
LLAVLKVVLRCFESSVWWAMGLLVFGWQS